MYINVYIATAQICIPVIVSITCFAHSPIIILEPECLAHMNIQPTCTTHSTHKHRHIPPT